MLQNSPMNCGKGWKANLTYCAGFPRKIFKYHINVKIYEGTALIAIRKLIWGALQPYLWLLTSELHKLFIDSQTIHDKVGSRDENSREHMFKVPKYRLSENKEVFLCWQLFNSPGSREC